MPGHVYLIGAGPGDIELITVKAQRLLSQCDIVFYDRLANPQLLELVPPTCIKVDVGKCDGQHVVEQENINELLWEAAVRYPIVVRLKGGDPHVFGRGGEEELTLKAKGIQFEVVPGISSAIAGPTYAGIPLTMRGVASCFAVVTGHECQAKNGALNWSALAKMDTLVILMGIKNRREIARVLIEEGCHEEKAVAFIENATTKKQKVIISNLRDISLGLCEVKSPAIMICGDVVKLHFELNWFDPARIQEKISQKILNTEVPLNSFFQKMPHLQEIPVVV